MTQESPYQSEIEKTLSSLDEDAAVLSSDFTERLMTQLEQQPAPLSMRMMLAYAATVIIIVANISLAFSILSGTTENGEAPSHEEDLMSMHNEYYSTDWSEGNNAYENK